MAHVISLAGLCPYCGSSDFDDTQDHEQNTQITAKKCNGCSNWSARHENGKQYPLSDKTDKDGDPALWIPS